jgi:hypothetical protein
MVREARKATAKKRETKEVIQHETGVLYALIERERVRLSRSVYRGSYGGQSSNPPGLREFF